MKTSISDTIATEKYLTGEMAAEDKLVFEARLVLEEDLRANTILHRIVHRLVALYHRKKIRASIEELHVKLFSDPANQGLRECVRYFKS